MDEMVWVNPPDWLMLEIFIRLPAKSLFRFKSLSKFYLSLIQHPFFIDRIRPKTPILWQIQHGRGLDVVSIECNGVSTLKHSPQFGDGLGGFRIFSGRYCNGLNCFFHTDKNNVQLWVCNVTTKECIILPRWCRDCVFCFDSYSKKFKILGWVKKSRQMPFDFCVLTLERDPSWRPISNPLNIAFVPERDPSWIPTMNPHNIDFVLEPDAIVNGEPFWLDYKETRIISFQPASEEFRVIDFPNVRQKTSWYSIFDFEGSLSFVEQHRREEPIFSLWILNDNGWATMKKNIAMPFEGTNLHEYYSRPGVQRWRAEGCNFSFRGGELLVAVVGDFDYQFMFIYNFLNNQFKRIKITGLPFCNFTMRNYMDSGLRMRNYVQNNVCLQEFTAKGREVVKRGDSSALEPVNM